MNKIFHQKKLYQYADLKCKGIRTISNNALNSYYFFLKKNKYTNIKYIN